MHKQPSLDSVSHDHNAGRGAELRRESRTIVSVLSEVFALEGSTQKYIGPGVVLDISESGLGLAMDELPRSQMSLVIKNAYFDVQAQIVNRTAGRDCTRIGLKFTSKVNWYRKLESVAVPAPQASSEARPAGNIPRIPAKSMWYERFQLYRRFLHALDGARRKLPASILGKSSSNYAVKPSTTAMSPGPCRWHEEYLVGVGELDTQHKFLVKAVNSVAAAVATKDASIVVILDNLVSRASKHFEDEELFMCWHGYPELEDHQVEHKRVLERLAEIRRALIADPSSLTEEVVQEVAQRLNDHILNDQRYAQYIRLTKGRLNARSC